MKTSSTQRNLIFLLFILIIQPFIPVSTPGHQESITSMKESVDTLTPAQTSIANIMHGQVEVTHTEQAFEGYNLFVLRERNITYPNNNQTLIIADMDGNVVYERVVTHDGLYELADVSVEIVNPSTLLLGIPFNTVLLNINNGSEQTIPFSGHHEYEYNPNNDTVFTFSYHHVMEGEIDCLYDILYEFDLNGDIVWELDVSSFITSDMWCPHSDMFGGARDITHSNTAFYDADEDIIYYNPRNVNTFYKIDHETSEVIWGLGEYGDFTLYNAEGEEVESLFYHPHAVEMVDDNTFILFDNDHHNQILTSGFKSRILEITINEDTMEAFETFSWEGPDEYYSFLWGDADRLPNGNRLGTFGAARRADPETGAHLVEVTDEGDIAWEFSFQNSETYRYGVYRMERFRYAPILSSPSDVQFTDEQDVVLDWQAWYNYRPKRTIVGAYSLTLYGIMIDSGTVSYDKFWRPSDISFDLGMYEPGQYEFMLEITDEEGHVSIDTVLVTVSGLPIVQLAIVVTSVCVVCAIVAITVFRKRAG